MDPNKLKIITDMDQLADDLVKISRFLLANPETAYEEFKACDYLTDFLETRGFDVVRRAGGIQTAFFARPKNCQPQRPAIAFLAEYDALPKIGHGCGHNLIAAASIGASLALHRCDVISPGSLAVIGTPAEEGGGGKVLLCDAGLFKALDAAFMFHPGRSDTAGKAMLGRTKFKLEFFGQAAHASGSPDQGINALDALIATFTHINALRQHLRSDARIHGIITHGGDAPNVIPDYAAGLFYVRAMSKSYRDEVFERVKACAQGAALATGARFTIDVSHPKLDPMKRNLPLEEAAKNNMKLLGITPQVEDSNIGSSDMGNLSWHLPAIHPYLSIVDTNVPSHSEAFAQATDTARGRTAMVNAAKMLAMTAYDFLTSKALQQKTAAAFDPGQQPITALP